MLNPFHSNFSNHELSVLNRDKSYPVVGILSYWLCWWSYMYRFSFRIRHQGVSTVHISWSLSFQLQPHISYVNSLTNTVVLLPLVDPLCVLQSVRQWSRFHGGLYSVIKSRTNDQLCAIVYVNEHVDSRHHVFGDVFRFLLGWLLVDTPRLLADCVIRHPQFGIVLRHKLKQWNKIINQQPNKLKL